MYNINDTIIAVSSGAISSAKKIIRISGDKTSDVLNSLVHQEIQKQRGIIQLTVNIDSFEIECFLYFFPSPKSYTGENLAEIHTCVCDEAVELIFSKLLSYGCRGALAGEFTYRAFINGKMDLSRAEAVSQIIESSNQYQLAAAQKLFSGSIEQKVGQIRQEILELLSLIEAGLDFGGEEIEIISPVKAIEAAKTIRSNLNELLCGSITYEQISQGPSAIIAGAANAGKSSLVNALLGANRSIVSDQSGTTRDVLEHWLKLDKCDCVLLDCAGVNTTAWATTNDTLEHLANEATKRAVQSSDVLIFCVDSSKTDYSEDLEILKNTAWAEAHPTIFTATKCDLLNTEKLKRLETIFKHKFLQTSVKNKTGLEELKKAIEQNIIRQTAASSESHEKTSLTQRHRTAVNDAVQNIENSITEIQNSNEEIAAFVLRAALESLSKLAAEHIDEAILDTIFSRFCIGK